MVFAGISTDVFSLFDELLTAVDNYTAQSLYEQVGFKKLEPEADFFTYSIILNTKSLIKGNST